jgi:hypothetical protein
MKKKSKSTLEVAQWLVIDPALLSSTAVELMKLNPMAAAANEDLKPFVAKAFNLLTLAHQYLEEHPANGTKKKA